MPKSKKKIQQEYSESDNAFTESDELAKESAKDSVFYKSVASKTELGEPARYSPPSGLQ